MKMPSRLPASAGRAVLVVTLLCGLVPAAARGCPFCSAVSLTFAQEIAQSPVAVIARLVEPPAAAALAPRAEGPLPKGKFRVVEVLKGTDVVAAAGLMGDDGSPIETIMLEEKPAGGLFLLMGVEPPALVWSSPVPLTERGVEYLRKLEGLPEKGPDRLAFFQDYFEDKDDTLARDAYDEFAVAPYADVKGLKSRMDPAQLLAWIENPKILANRRRLYATMLGVCGSEADAARIAAILEAKDLPPEEAEVRNGLDALIACYVTLRGEAGLDLVDRLFLDREGKDVPFAETYAAVMALRFLGEESDIVPRPRVLQSLRLLLAEPKLADLVIADLARWEDWSVIDTLVGLFKNAGPDNIFVREPVVNYLRACPLPEAAAAVKELEAIDPEAVRRAATLAGLAGVVAGAAPAADGDPGDPGNTAAAVPTDPGAHDLARQITPVLGDEDATDDIPGAEPAAAARAAGAKASGGARVTWKWIVWLAVVTAVALASRRLFRSGGSSSAAAR